ncbi:membrane hypothetical protein [Flavobacterium sp. 9R]|uniref:hypothetical protein n=1 Tax=Flavobacterium sp. 9R TaxID=2653143 RepID=UPI0012F38D93|nr:hypothetical protein [Flavobacterium sp. 9R]VXB46710.1 membrane hypothetical protein [Flavobacterium sp. 9R]
MSEIINCPSCGASNQLPEGKNTMFCAFCGNLIQKMTKADTRIKESSIKTKPQISTQKTEKKDVLHLTKSGKFKYKKEENIIDYGGELSLVNRGIESLEEITSWFSDNELVEIVSLCLNDNNINSLSGIERYTKLENLYISNNKLTNLEDFAKINNGHLLGSLDLKNNKLCSTKYLSKFSTIELDISENEIVVLDDIPQFRPNFFFKKINSISLSNNTKLKKFSQDVVTSLSANVNRIDSLTINLIGCLEFDQNCLNSLKVNEYIRFFLILDKKTQLSGELMAKGFELLEDENTNKEGMTYCFTNKSRLKTNTEKKDNIGGFIANATMKLSFWNWVHLTAPYLFAIIYCNYTGETFLKGLGVCLFFVFIICAIPHSERDVKTGKSFISKYGKFDEYKTLRGERMGDAKANISILHLVTLIVLIIYGFSISKNSDYSNNKEDDVITTVAPKYSKENNSNINTYQTASESNDSTYNNYDTVSEENIESNTNPNFVLGKNYDGGTIIYLDDTNEHGIICSEVIITDRVNTLEISKQKSMEYSNENNGNWRLPSESDFKLIAKQKNIIDLKGETFWTSNENSDLGLVYESFNNSFGFSRKNWESSALVFVKDF